jgi:N-acetylmuramoyl-L-alanine amidase
MAGAGQALDAYPERFLPYVERLAIRDPGTIEGVVIHCTELPDLAMAREFGEQIHHAGSQTGNCGHYYLDRDGRIEIWAPVGRVAHHTRGYNELTVGIELVNSGRYPDWLHSEHQDLTEPYPDAQIHALTGLLARLAGELSGLRWIAGHEDLDQEQVPASNDPALLVSRKRDPGPMFPWRRVAGVAGLTRQLAQGG